MNCHGEFYGFEKIQRALKQLGYQLQTNYDSEIAMHLYDRYGSNCLHHLRVEFAFAILTPILNACIFQEKFAVASSYICCLMIIAIAV